MPPKTRNGEGSLKGQSQPVLLKQKQQLPPLPRQRRSEGKSVAASVEGPVTLSDSSSKGVTAHSRQDVHSLEHPQQSVPLLERTRRDNTPIPIKSHQSQPQTDDDDGDNPLVADIKAQNLVIEEHKELIRQLQGQLWEKKKSLVPRSRHNQTPSVEQDLRQVLNNKRCDRAYDEGSSSNHLNEDSKRLCQKPEDNNDLREWIDRQVKQAVQ
ncbi:hypothetical protein AAC387_Pa06g1712 [Persea americana]